MKQDKMHLINKIFNNETIRTVWDKEEEKYYISVVDIVGVLSGRDNSKKYCSFLKSRLKKEGNETVTICSQLKLKKKEISVRKNRTVEIKILRWYILIVNISNKTLILKVNKKIGFLCYNVYIL